MPGPVSDSFDQEFGTGANAADVRDALLAEALHLGKYLGERKNIVEVVHGKPGRFRTWQLSERGMRILRFALERAVESI